MVKTMEKDEIKQEVDRIEEELKGISSDYYYQCLERVKRMYPPDGGGHGYKWREKIKENNRQRDHLKARLVELKARLAELEKDF